MEAIEVDQPHKGEVGEEEGEDKDDHHQLLQIVEACNMTVVCMALLPPVINVVKAIDWV